jgi:predicted NUDIX family NTP pyrophosphohydrolase
MAKLISAGLLCYRRDAAGALEVLLAHPGGPFFARKDAGAWSIPKGVANPGEDLLDAARREFAEELGWAPDEQAAFLSLGWVRMKSGKTVHAWAFASGRKDVFSLTGTSVFTLEWPPKSGRQQTFPEIDRAEFFSLPQAAEKILPVQQPFLERLLQALPNAPS